MKTSAMITNTAIGSLAMPSLYGPIALIYAEFNDLPLKGSTLGLVSFLVMCSLAVSLVIWLPSVWIAMRMGMVEYRAYRVGIVISAVALSTFIALPVWQMKYYIASLLFFTLPGFFLNAVLFQYVSKYRSND